MKKITIECLVSLLAVECIWLAVADNGIEDEGDGNLEMGNIDVGSADASSGDAGGDGEGRGGSTLAYRAGNASSGPPASAANGSVSGAGYGFFRTMGEHGRWVDTRRVFGGAAARLEEFPAICALLDRFMGARCSGSVLTPHWVLTAAHCISPNLAYAKYNTRHPLRTNDGKVVAVQYLYKHPDYKVVQEDVGRGLDVTVLHHDMGLVRTRKAMTLTLRAQVEPVQAMLTYNAQNLKDKEVQVLGYGRTETRALGEELLSVQLRLVSCDRPAWQHCVCGVASRGASSGVCSGDSGGPVLYKGVQVAVTSMGPLECARENSTWPARATSVFTVLQPYSEIVNHTILDAERSMKRLYLDNAAPEPRAAPPLLAAFLPLVLM